MSRLRSLAGFSLLAAVALTSVACNRVRVEDVRGPDGGEWLRISCRRMDKKCFRAAAARCPNGYYFATSAGRVPAAIYDREETDEPEPGPRAAPPRADLNATTLPPEERWGSHMYSKKSGVILVQCATASASASN